MREKFWEMIVNFKIAERYYWYYTCDSKKWNNVITGICLLTSASSISACYFWKQFPIIWAVIIAAAQVVSVCKPLFPFDNRLVSARYIYQDIVDLMVDVEDIWGVDGSEITESDFKSELSKYVRRYNDIENRFSKPDLFPAKKRLHDKAQRDAALYFRSRYNVKAVDLL